MPLTVVHSMSVAEYSGWCAYFDRKHREEKKAMEKAKSKRR